MVTCEICKQEFENKKVYANHVRWKHKDQTAYKEKRSQIAKGQEKRYGKWIHEETTCSKDGCDAKFDIKYREGKRKEKWFCSRSCANSRKHSNKTKERIANGVSSAWKQGVFDEVDYGSHNLNFSSKREREIVKHFKETYPEYEWKSGGRLKTNPNTYLSRDLWSDKLKVCFEYDGIWHFKDIHGQLKSKKHKDQELENWCLSNGYKLVRVQEGQEDMSQIENAIFNDERQIIKLGSGY